MSRLSINEVATFWVGRQKKKKIKRMRNESFLIPFLHSLHKSSPSGCSPSDQPPETLLSFFKKPTPHHSPSIASRFHTSSFLVEVLCNSLPSSSGFFAETTNRSLNRHKGRASVVFVHFKLQMGKRARKEVGSSSQAPTAEYSLEIQATLAEFMSKRSTFISDRGFNKEFRNGPEMRPVRHILEKREWMCFAYPRKRVCTTLVREFYATLHHSEDGEIVLRGVPMSVTGQRLNEFYNIPPPRRCAFKDLMEKELTEELARDIADTLQRIPIEREWGVGPNSMMLLARRTLTPEAKIWFYLSTASIMPTLHNSEVRMERAKFLYAVIKDEPVNLGDILAARMKRCAMASKGALWYPSCITEFCEAHKVPQRPHDEYTKPAGTFTFAWYARMEKNEQAAIHNAPPLAQEPPAIEESEGDVAWDVHLPPPSAPTHGWGQWGAGSSQPPSLEEQMARMEIAYTSRLNAVRYDLEDRLDQLGNYFHYGMMQQRDMMQHFGTAQGLPPYEGSFMTWSDFRRQEEETEEAAEEEEEDESA